MSRLSDEMLLIALFLLLAAVTLLDQLQTTLLIAGLQTILAVAALISAAIIIRRHQTRAE